MKANVVGLAVCSRLDYGVPHSPHPPRICNREAVGGSGLGNIAQSNVAALECGLRRNPNP